MEVEDKHKIKKNVLELLTLGDLDRASALIAENNLSNFDTNEIAEKAFRLLLKDRNMAVAIAVCEEFNMPVELRLEAISAQFKDYTEKKEYDKAFNWGIKYNMSKNDLNNMSVKAYNDELKEKNISRALELKEKFNIPDDLLISVSRQSFNDLFEKTEYIKALRLGLIFDVSRKRTLTAGIRGYQKLLAQQKIKEFLNIENKYHLLHDRDLSGLDNKDQTNFNSLFNENITMPLLNKNEPDELHQIMETLKILQISQDTSPLLSELVLKITKQVELAHREYIFGRKYHAAVEIAKNFKLIEKESPADVRTDVINAAEDAHNKLMKEGELSKAKFLKENYLLFDQNLLANSMESVAQVTRDFLITALNKGEIDDAQDVIKEYNVPLEIVVEEATKAVLGLLETEQYAKVLETIRAFKLKISDPDIIGEAVTCFHRLYESGNMEVASGLAYHFKIKEPRVNNATFSHWKSIVEKGEYVPAKEFSKRMHIPRNMTEPFIKEYYNRMIEEKRHDEAVVIRQTFRVNISILDWLIEAIKKIFGK
ncbi:hypothetical protein ACFL6O_00610 [candidate division KSB1 bacterium]